MCCPKKIEACIQFPGEEEPECAKGEQEEVLYKSVDDLKQFYGLTVFNNYACYDEYDDYDEPGTEFECKSLGECPTEGEHLLDIRI